MVATADIERAAAAFADGLPESSTGPCVGTARVPATPNTVQKLTIDDCMARSRGSLRPWKHGRRRPVLTTHAPALRTAVRHMPEMSEAGLLQHAWPLRVPSGSRWHALRPRRPPAHLRRSESAPASQRRSEGSMRAAVHLTCVCVIHHGNQQSCRPAVLRCHRRHRHECSPRVLEPRHELGCAI